MGCQVCSKDDSRMTFDLFTVWSDLYPSGCGNTGRNFHLLQLGVNNQFINVVCKNRRKQYWFTTGDSQVTS